MTALATKTDHWADLVAKSRRIEPMWLSAFREAGAARFAELGFPTTDHEDWRFTSVAAIAETAFVVAPEAKVSASDAAPFLHDLGGPRLVFANGRFAPALSNVGALPKGVALMSLREAAKLEEGAVRERLGSLTNNATDHFAALNNALFNDGIYLSIAPNVALEAPIEVLFLSTGAGDPAFAASRNLIRVGAGAQATIVETHAGLGCGTYFNSVATEVHLGANANVDHYRLQLESGTAFHISSLRFRQDRDSNYRVHGFDFGGALVRNDVRGDLVGKGCEAIVNGLYVLNGRQHVDNHMWMEHRDEHIPSHELFKGVLDGESSSVFTGRIYVHPEAQKTDAKQTNQNLILSDAARATARPQLEIYADDVKCTHGATIGTIDDTALFYLMSRGVDREAARNLLIHAFAADIVERVRIDAVRESVEKTLSERLRR